MAHRNTSVTAPERVHRHDELFLTKVSSANVHRFQTRITVEVRVNRDGMRKRFGAILGTALEWHVVRRAAKAQ